MSAGNGDSSKQLASAISRFLSSVYYGIATTALLITVVVYVVTIRIEVVGLIEREKLHPSKTELLITESKVNELNIRVSEMDIRGTRALTDKINVAELGNRNQDQRIAEIVSKLGEAQGSIIVLDRSMTLIKERQDNIIGAVRELQSRAMSSERGPTGPGRFPPSQLFPPVPQ
jgi:hypothetical protein